MFSEGKRKCSESILAVCIISSNSFNNLGIYNKDIGEYALCWE